MISLKKQIAEAFEIEGWQRRSVFFCLDRLAQIFMLSAGCIRSTRIVGLSKMPRQTLDGAP